MPDIPAWTVPAAVEAVQSPDPDPDPDPAPADVPGAEATGTGELTPADVTGAEATGTGELTPAVPVVVPVPQAASVSTAAMARRGDSRLDMACSKVRDEPFGAFSSIYVGTTRPVSAGRST
jgi:hypothetical protein